MQYQVNLKNAGQRQAITATTELEAKIKYCQERGYDYRVFANKLEVKQKKGGKNNGQK